MKDLLWMVLGTVVGGVLLVVGINGLNSDTVSCGGKTMSEGDICRTDSKERTLAEQRSVDNRGNYAMIGIGALFLVGGGGILLTGIVGAIRDRDGAGSNGPRPDHVPNPAQPGFGGNQPAGYQPPMGNRPPTIGYQPPAPPGPTSIRADGKQDGHGGQDGPIRW